MPGNSVATTKVNRQESFGSALIVSKETIDRLDSTFKNAGCSIRQFKMGTTDRHETTGQTFAAVESVHSDWRVASTFVLEVESFEDSGFRASVTFERTPPFYDPVLMDATGNQPQVAAFQDAFKTFVRRHRERYSFFVGEWWQIVFAIELMMGALTLAFVFKGDALEGIHQQLIDQPRPVIVVAIIWLLLAWFTLKVREWLFPGMIFAIGDMVHEPSRLRKIHRVLISALVAAIVPVLVAIFKGK